MTIYFMRDKIRLVTTIGCEACKIMRGILSDIINSDGFEKIDFEEIPFNETTDSFIKQNEITDFPTICFIKDELVVDKLIGTTTHNNLKNKIKSVYGLNP